MDPGLDPRFSVLIRCGIPNNWTRPLPEIAGSDISYVRQLCFRKGKRASGPDFGRILVGETSKSVFQGRPEADFEAFPIRIGPKLVPEARCLARKH